MSKQNDRSTYIAERVRALATMYLTRRDDLIVRPQKDEAEWVDYLVEIDNKGKTGRRVFGVELRGTMSPVSDEQANRVLYPSIQSMRRRGDFPFPVCMFYFTMEDNEGRYTWIAEPIIEDGEPILRYHEAADTKKLDKRSLDQIVDQINKWFDEMPADAGSVACAECDRVLYGEFSSADPSQRKPCPKCGSTKRAFSVHASDEMPLSVSAHAEVMTYPQSLLKAARDLIKKKQYGDAVVTAHLACEIATERSMSEAFVAKKVEFLEKTIEELISGFNLANENTRKLYTALTRDEIQDQPFWEEFKESASRRNLIIHSGKTVSRAEAEASLQAAMDLVRHLNKSILWMR